MPNVYELYYSATPELPNPLLRPETMRSFESVWEQSVNQHLWFSASAFFNGMHHLITQVPQPDGSLIFRNVQNVNSSGLELEARAQLAQGFEGTASYSFQETKDRIPGDF